MMDKLFESIEPIIIRPLINNKVINQGYLDHIQGFVITESNKSVKIMTDYGNVFNISYFDYITKNKINL